MKRFFTILFMTASLLAGVTGAGAQSMGDNMPIRPGDLVEVKVFREEDLSGKMRVSSEGDISLPLIGLVRVGGISPEAASQAVRSKLADGYLVEPNVLITVSEYSKQLYTVLGQVQKPGTYEMPTTGKVSLLQAIGMAGGYTRIANPSKVVIKRSIRGVDKVFEINAKRLTKESGGTTLLLQAGDVVTVAESLF